MNEKYIREHSPRLEDFFLSERLVDVDEPDHAANLTGTDRHGAETAFHSTATLSVRGHIHGDR